MSAKWPAGFHDDLVVFSGSTVRIDAGSVWDYKSITVQLEAFSRLREARNGHPSVAYLISSSRASSAPFRQTIKRLSADAAPTDSTCLRRPLSVKGAMVETPGIGAIPFREVLHLETEEAAPPQQPQAATRVPTPEASVRRNLRSARHNIGGLRAGELAVLSAIRTAVRAAASTTTSEAVAR